MSRKPPKLFPIEDKVSVAPSDKRVQECMPPLRPGGPIEKSSAGMTSATTNRTPMARRSAPTRNFLNCNGANRRRFIGNVGSGAGANDSSTRTLLSPVPKVDTGSTNGCGSDDAAEESINKVNGTMSNGISSSSTKSNEPTKKSITRQKSSDVEEQEEDKIVSSDSHQQQNNSSIKVNGNKSKDQSSTNVESTNSVSLNNSQSINANNNNNSTRSSNVIARRTSRFSQSASVVSNVQRKNVPPSSNDGDGNPSESEALSDAVAIEVSNSDPEPAPESKDGDGDDHRQEVSPTAGEISDTPKIIRKGDTVIKSYVDEKTGRIVVFEKGMNLEVCDFGSGKWYPAKVNNINWNKREILVHYSNWSSRFDEWINMRNHRLRPSKNTNVTKLQYAVGERVEAVWPKDNQKYPGTILKVLPDDMYEVLFVDDGIKMKRSENQLFKVSQGEPPALEKCVEESTKPPTLKQVSKTPVPGKRRSMAQASSSSSNLSESVTSTPKSKTVASTAKETPPLEPSTPTPSRPAHFSVFDVPKEELGKRKRSTPNYYIMAKGNPRGIRRPRSEGSKTATNSAPTTDDEGSHHEDSHSATETPEPSLPLSRRRKSAAANKIPSAQPSPTESSSIELPASSSTPSGEAAPTTTPVEQLEEKDESSKRNKRQLSATPTTTSTAVGALSSDSKTSSPSKVEATPIPQVSESTLGTASSAAATPSPVPAPPTTQTRRPRSVGITLPPTPVYSDVPRETKVDSGFVDEFGNPIIIEQKDNNGFWQCPLNNCGKNFRKDSLLKMHLKHYHPELKPTCLVANVVQMAQARHAFDSYTGEHLPSWPKGTSGEQASTRESSPVGRATGEVPVTPDLQDLPPAQKKVLKSTPSPHSKEASIILEKISPQGGHKSEQDLSPSKAGTEGTDLTTSDPTKALTQSPRLRHKKPFIWTKSGHRKSTLTVTTPVPPRRRLGVSKDVVIGTEGNKKNKLSESTVDLTDVVSSEQSVDSPANSLEFSNTPSPSVVSDQKSEFSIESCSGSSSSEPYLVPPFGESESYSSHGRARGRWSKSQFRRGLMNSGMRRSASGMVPSATSILLKKRLGNYRKLIGKRSRQKRTSILSRISSGRMRVILESLNQRSLRKKRFLATRRGRDVKVDVINCICSNKTEFGLMIQCELCLCWQHGSCFNVQTNSQLPDFYACQSCSEPEKARLSRKYEWAEAEFYKLGKLPSFSFAPSFPKEDAKTMKMCTNLTSDLAESYSMIKKLKVKQRICFGHPEHPKLYQWNTERCPPQEEIQRDKFRKYFQPVLRRLLLENKSDPAYQDKLKKLADTRIRLRKYADAIESARSTIKKKLGCRAAAFLEYICGSVLDEMTKQRRILLNHENGIGKKEGGSEIKKRSAEMAFHRLVKVKDEILKKQAAELSHLGLVCSPSKSNQLTTSVKHLNKSAQQSFMNGANVNFSMKGAPQVSNGMQKDVSANIRDFCLLKKYLKEKRTVDSNISITIDRMAKEFPEDWRNLMKLCRGFVDETGKESAEEDRVKWVSDVIVTFNNLKILLKQIYSESNIQRQKLCASEFEKSTIKLFDLFGVGLTEERLEKKKVSPKLKNRRIRGLETLDMVHDSSPNLDVLKLGEIPATLEEEHGEMLDRLGSSSTDSDAQKDSADLPDTSRPVAKLVGVNRKDGESKAEASDDFLKVRGLDGIISFDFTGSITFQEALENIPDFLLDACSEEDIDFPFPEVDSDSAVEESSKFTGIIPVPAASRITPEVCKKNLVQDILLQQQQIDLYLDKIENQIIKLTSQSRFRGAVTSAKPSDLSLQRDKMLHSLELVNRLTKTMIGENDAAPGGSNEVDASETTVTDDSSDSSSSDSEAEDETSNYSGTDTETADEGDNSGDDELLDV